MLKAKPVRIREGGTLDPDYNGTKASNKHEKKPKELGILMWELVLITLAVRTQGQRVMR